VMGNVMARVIAREAQIFPPLVIISVTSL